ncbi:MAG: hypothetical protein H7296_09500 [Bacteroidia bacterium]|nr:hypothetical protein [Bacteroidia bacterium]
MKQVYKAGDIKTYDVIVKPADTAAFDSGTVHPVYATFALGRDAEWCCRLFALDMKENDEEGIGTSLHIEHLMPALVGSAIHFTATLISLNGNEIICSYEARNGERLIAKGTQCQKILKKESIEKIFKRLS